MATGTSCEVHSGGKNQGRALGNFERFSASLTDMCSSAIYWHTAVINTSRAFKDDDVIAACKIMVRKQEALQMCILPTDNNSQSTLQFRYVPMKIPEKIDFESTAIKSKEDWPTLTSKYHNEHKIDIVNGPLWRIILAHVAEAEASFPEVHQYVILLKFIHTIVDGLSVFDLLTRQFLPILSAVINCENEENIVPFVLQTKSVEEFFPQAKVSLPCCTKLRLDFLRWKHRTFNPDQCQVYMFPDETPSFTTKNPNEAPCIPKIFDEKICVSVIAAAKKHGVTVHGVLLSAGALALAKTAKQAAVKIPVSFVQTWPISLRKHLDFHTPLPLGYFVSTGRTNHKPVTDVTEEEFWRSCQTLQKQVQLECQLDKCINDIRGFKYLVNAAETTDLVTILSEMGSPPNLFLSNLGNTDAVKPNRVNTIEHSNIDLSVDVDKDTDKNKEMDLNACLSTGTKFKVDMNIGSNTRAYVNTDADLKDDRYTNADSQVNATEEIPTTSQETAMGSINTTSSTNATVEPIKIQVKEQYFHLTGLAVVSFCPIAQFVLTFEKRFMWNISYNPNTVSRRFVKTYLENLEVVFKTFCRDEKEEKKL